MLDDDKGFFAPQTLADQRRQVAQRRVYARYRHRAEAGLLAVVLSGVLVALIMHWQIAVIWLFWTGMGLSLHFLASDPDDNVAKRFYRQLRHVGQWACDLALNRLRQRFQIEVEAELDRENGRKRKTD
jgi:hypothetical protein